MDDATLLQSVLATDVASDCLDDSDEEVLLLSVREQLKIVALVKLIIEKRSGFCAKTCRTLNIVQCALRLEGVQSMVQTNISSFILMKTYRGS